MTNLEPHQRLALVVLPRRRAARLAPDDAQLHMLDLQPDEQEINAADDHVLEVVPRLAVLEFNVQAVLDTDVHFDDAVGLWGHAVAVHPQVFFADRVGHAPRHGHTHKVAQAHVDARVRLVRLLDVFEVEGEGVRVRQLAGGCEFRL